MPGRRLQRLQEEISEEACAFTTAKAAVTGFFRFPSTPHLAWLGDDEPRHDKVLSSTEAVELLSGEVAIEEKLDGANLGFSLGPAGELHAQNRGQFLSEPLAGQFVRLPAWLGSHGEAMAEALLDHVDKGLVLFGEWCAARHSLAYTRLPDWYLLFDVYETRSGRFWSSARRNALATTSGLTVTPQLTRGRYAVGQLQSLLSTQVSRFTDGPPEGIVIRRENDDWCEQRAKLVRSDFTQAISDHWRSRRIEWNRLDAHVNA